MIELWLPIKGYEGLYEISNMGNVRSVARIEKIHKKWKRDAEIKSRKSFEAY